MNRKQKPVVREQGGSLLDEYCAMPTQVFSGLAQVFREFIIMLAKELK